MKQPRLRLNPATPDKPVIFTSDDAIALAGFSDQKLAVNNFDFSTRLFDNALTFKLGQAGGHTGTPNSQRHREKVVRQRNDVVLQTVLSQQQPTCQSFLQFMPRVTKRGLRI